MTCIFSGDYSRDMWKAINAVPDEKTHRALYLLGCRLQEFEWRHAVGDALPPQAATTENPMTDEASKLLREFLDVTNATNRLDAEYWRRLASVQSRGRAYLAALPVAAPREDDLLVWRNPAPDAAAAAVISPSRTFTLGAAAQPAPLPGPPREPTLECDFCGKPFRTTMGLQTHTCAAELTTDQGDCVIAPNPTGVQGQSTMQASNVTGNSAMSEPNAEAKGLSRAGDDAAGQGQRK